MTDLGNRYALSALKAKRASLAGEIAAMKKKLAWAEDSLRHVDACLMLLEPTGDPSAIPAKRPQKRVKLFRQGELSGSLLAILRASRVPLSTIEVVAALIERGGLSDDAKAALAPRVRGNLSYLESLGRIAKLGHGRGARWTSKMSPVIPRAVA
jgi:hypothetical protein